MVAVEEQYLGLLARVRERGERREDRTGVGTLSVFGASLEHDLADGTFPLLTTKFVHFKSVVHELLWMLRGETNVRSLQRHNISIWDEWADDDGELGPVYGAQWRSFGGVDQIARLLHDLEHSPRSRRLIVNAWNAAQVDRMALPPCHMFFQCYVDGEERLSLQMYQRSADLFLGVPFNIASYALLTHLLANATGLGCGVVRIVFGDAHIYLNHLRQVDEQRARAPYPLPRVTLSAAPGTKPWDVLPEDIELHDYRHHPAIRGKVAV